VFNASTTKFEVASPTVTVITGGSF
jgi:hypothetical protein